MQNIFLQKLFVLAGANMQSTADFVVYGIPID